MKPAMSVLAVIILSIVCGCAPVAREYKGLQPQFDLGEYLVGDLVGHGIFFDRSGRVATRFKVEIHGVREEQGLSMHETITYVNGDIEKRVWQLKKESSERYTATTSDVNGTATVDNFGFAAQWHYQMALKVDGEVYNIDFDDWMYLLGDGVMLNRATASKFGFKVGEVMISFRHR